MKVKETKEILKKYGHDIILSVIVSIITGLILGAGNWLIKTVPAVGHSFFEAIRNIVYSLAATMSDNMLNFLIVAFILAGIILVVFVVLEYGVSLLKRVYVFGKKENEQLNNLQKILTNYYRMKN